MKLKFYSVFFHCFRKTLGFKVAGRSSLIIFTLLSKVLLHTGIILILSEAFIYAQAIRPVNYTEISGDREKLLMDSGWRFAFGHPYDAAKDFNHGTGYFSYLAKAGYGDGPAAADFDDRGWRLLDVPHDWAVEQPFSEKGSHSHGYKAVGRNFPETSVGWYRKKFTVPESDFGRKISIEFDGVFRDSKVWVNGFYLGHEPSGYSGFTYDLTDYLNYGGENVVAVRVDVTLEEGWFYEGAGIYRHVWLTKTNPLHVDYHGTFVTSELKGNIAEITAKATIVNETHKPANFEITQKILDKEGAEVASGSISSLSLQPGASEEFSTKIDVHNPRLWSLEDPYLHKLVTIVKSGGHTTDRYETTFGIRTIRFDANDGFFLNGKPVKLKGTNNHQDHAGVGTAIPDGLQEYRIAKLKEMGSNAYRCSHNPPTPELLNACDKLGMLVIDENRIMGTNPAQLDYLKRLMLRDRNHPSIIAWSIGNEEWAIEGNEKGERIAAAMQNFAKRIDPTRPVNVASSGGWGQGVSKVIETMGFNYLAHGSTDKHHQNFPDQPGIGTEEGSTYATRGVYFEDKEKQHLPAYDVKPRPNWYSIQEAWKHYAQRPYLAGMFIWTGFDYRGEPTPFGWPSNYSYFGMLDACGFPKDNFYYLKSWWTNEPTLHIFPHWNWKGKEGQDIRVVAYSNYDEVELFLNKKSLGKKVMDKNSHIEWDVRYAPGTLMAIGYKNGKQSKVVTVETTGNPDKIELVPHKTLVRADGEDVVVVTVRINDNKKRLVPTAENEVNFEIEGPAKIIGVGNGDPTSLEPDKFIRKVNAIRIENLREKIVDKRKNLPEVAFVFDDAKWKKAFQNQGDEDKAAGLKVYRGSFMINEVSETADVTLLFRTLAEDQDVYVNGKLISENVARNKQGYEYTLDRKLLRKGRNVVAVVGTPVVKKHEWESINTEAGLIKIEVPADQWKRSTFNGLAQIIIQTTKEPGEITLKAESSGLKPGILKFQSQIAEPRPSVD